MLLKESKNQGGEKEDWICLEEAAKRLQVSKKDISLIVDKCRLRFRNDDQDRVIINILDVAYVYECILFGRPLDEIFPKRKWARRKCVLCGKKFLSRDPSHRVCKRCRPLFEELRAIYPAGMLNIKDTEMENDDPCKS